MKIVLVRHLRVDYTWKWFYDSAKYQKACSDYDLAGVISNEARFMAADIIITSTMRRAIETSPLLFGKMPDHIDDSIVEVPIKPFVNTKLIFPKTVWDVMGRFQWRLGCKTQPESYNESKARVDSFVNKYIRQHKDCIIICHGWTMKLMMTKLKKEGFTGQNPMFITTGKPYVYSKQ